MEIVKLVITIMFYTVSSFAKPRITSNILSCNVILPVEVRTLTVLLDMDPISNADLKNCILKSSQQLDQSFLLVNFYDENGTVNLYSTKNFRETTDQPNIIIMSKYLTAQILDSPVLRLLTKSHWSLVYIVITNDTEFQCEGDTMNANDFLRLDNIMNILWHKYEIGHVGVAFPFACRDKMVVYNEKRPSSERLFDRPIQLINATNNTHIYDALMKSGYKLADQYPLRASIFYRYPTSIKDCKNLHYYFPFNLNLSRGYCGLDGLVMHDVLTYLKFNLSFPENEYCNNYGYVSAGNATGSLGCIIRQELDISFNSRFMTLYEDERIYYLHYVISDSLCALVKTPNFIPIWHGVFNVYEGYLWLIISVLVVAIGIIMWVTAMIHEAITGEKSMSIGFYVYDAVMTCMFGCSPRKTKTCLILRSSCLLVSIFFLAVYQGHINHVYTTLKRFERIRTLEQLYRSGSTLYTSPSVRVLINQLHNPEDLLQRDFFNRARLTPDDRLSMILQRPDATTLDRKSDAMMEIVQNYSDASGKPLIDIIEECLYTYYLSYSARSGFPFYKDMKKFIERLMEAGLPAMYYKWTQKMLGLPNIKTEYSGEPRPFSKISLKDQRVAFGVLLFGYGLSVLVFVVEVCRGRRYSTTLSKRRIS